MSDKEMTPERSRLNGSVDRKKIADDEGYNKSRSKSRSNSPRRHRSSSRRRSSSRSRRRRHRSRSSDDGYSRSRHVRSRSRSSDRRRRHASNRDPQPCRCVGIFGLNLRTQEKDLKEVFASYGPIEKITIVYDAQTGRSRGFAFCYFEYEDDAKSAKDNCNGIEIDGRKIRVDFSITQRPHTPTPGIYMGRPTYPRYGGRSRGSYGGGGGGGGGGYYRDRSPSPYYRGRRYSRSRSRSFSPRRYGGYY